MHLNIQPLDSGKGGKMAILAGHNLWATEILATARSKQVAVSDTNPRVRLFRHKLPDGRIFTEFVQGQVNEKSGVIVFLAFKDEQGNVVKESLWKEHSMKSEV